MHRTEPTPWFSRDGLSLSILQDGGDTQDRYTLIAIRQPAGHVTQIHEHLRHSETNYVLDGLLCLQNRQGVRELRAGEAATIVEGASHRLANRSGAEARYLQVCRLAGGALLRERGASAPDAHVLPADALPPLDQAPLVAGTTPSSFDLIGIGIDVIETWGDGDEDLALVRAAFPPGTIVPLHSHREPETFYVLNGRLEIYRDGPDAGWTFAAPGAVVSVPANTRHAVRNAARTPCAALTLTRRRLLQFFLEGARPANAPKGPPSPLEVRDLFEVGQRFGYWTGSPADNETIGLTL